MKALPPVPVISTSGFDRAVACSDELVGDRCRLRHKIRTHSAGCYGQSQAGQDRPPGSRGDEVLICHRPSGRIRHVRGPSQPPSDASAPTPPCLSRSQWIRPRRRNIRIFCLRRQCCGSWPWCNTGVALWHVTSLRLRRWHDVQQPLLHPDRDLGDDVHRLAALGVDGGRPSRAERQLPGHCLVAEKNFDGINAA